MHDQSAIEQVIEKRFFQQAPLLVALANVEGRFLKLGGEWTATLGWSQEELLSRPFLEFVHPDDLPATLGELERLSRGEKTVRFQNRYRTRDGHWCHLQWYSHVPGDGTVFAIAQDVTESTRRDLELGRRTAILEAVTALQYGYVRGGEIRNEALLEALQQVMSLSGSRFGFFAELLKDAGSQPRLISIAVANDAEAVFAPSQLVLADFETPWGSVVRLQRPIRQDAAQLAGASNDLNVPLASFIGVPLIGEAGPVGLVALFNSPEGYDDSWFALLAPLARSVAAVLEVRRWRERETALQSEVRRWSDLFASVIRTAGVSVVTTDTRGLITFANPTALALLGAGALKDLQSTNLASFHDPAELLHAVGGRSLAAAARLGTPFDVVVSSALAAGGAERREWTYVSLSGERHPMMVALSALHDATGAISGWVAVGTLMSGFREIESERARTRDLEQQLAVLKRREAEVARLGEACQYVEVSKSLRDALKVIGAHLPLIHAEAAPQLLVLRAGDAGPSGVGTAHRTGGLADTTELPAFKPLEAGACWAFKTGQLFISEPGLVRCRHLAGTEQAFACVPLSDGSRTVAALSAALSGSVGQASSREPDALRERQLAGLQDQARQFSRVLFNQRLRLTLEQQATQDPLTGAANRRQLEVDLRLAVRHLEHGNGAFALLMLDVDHFKYINDALGHERGDLVLAGLVRLLKEKLRTTDLVARLGGEEFVVLLRDVDAGNAVRLAEKLRADIQNAQLAGDGATCTCSIGVLHVSQPGVVPDLLLRAADDAMYSAKASGRNTVVEGHLPQGAG
ncbi:MAG: hypothetical protein RL026_1642 [Pseudomonadota bacterium]